MKIQFTIEENTFVVSCSNPIGVPCNKWYSGLRNCFDITLKVNDGRSIRFHFYDSIANYPNPIDEKGLKSAFECYVNDAIAALSSLNLDDFLSNFGWNMDSGEGFRAWYECNKALGFFRENGVDVVKLQEFLDN